MNAHSQEITCRFMNGLIFWGLALPGLSKPFPPKADHLGLAQSSAELPWTKNLHLEQCLLQCSNKNLSLVTQ